MFLGVHHIGYYVANLEETIKQYVDLYGGEVEMRGRTPATKCNVAFVKTGATRVELMEPDDKSLLGGSKSQVLHHVGYEVADIQKAIEELSARGAKFQAPFKNQAGWTIAYFDGGDWLGAKQHLLQS
ncbi:MAG: VOC family protein [Chloroflexota bacterium]